MKNFSTLLLGLALAATASAEEKPVLVTTFPSPVPATTGVKPALPLHAPLNQEKELGTLVYASSQSDLWNEPGLVRFYTSNYYEQEKLSIAASSDDDVIAPRTTYFGGTIYKDEEGNKSYLAYNAINYDMGFTYPQYFYSIDLETGERTQLADLTEVKNSWLVVDGMAQNPVDGKLYATVRATDGLYSLYGTVNPKNGEFTLMGEMGDWYPDIAFDADGNLYGIRSSLKETGETDEYGNPYYEVKGSVLAKLNPENMEETEFVSLTAYDQNFQMWWNNTFTIDYTTGEFWGLLCDYNSWGWSQGVYKINPETGELTGYGSSYSVCAGMAIPYVEADSREAAYKVSNVSSTFGDKGASVTLTWTNPTTQWNGEELKELAEVRIFLDSPDALPYAIVPAEGKMGEEMSWTDEDPGQGVRTYYIVPCRKEGEKGVPEKWDAWGGADMPAAPEYVQAQSLGTSIQIEWPASVSGSHGGWLDVDNVTYTVTRYPDEVVVATGLTECKYVDNSMPQVNNYSYEVAGVSVAGTGEGQESNSVMAGPAYDLPFSVTIDTYEKGEAWTIVDNNQDGTRFWYSSYAPTGLMLYTNKPGESDDYAISPAVKLEKDKLYKVDMTININYPYDEEDFPDNLHSFDFTAGQGISAEAQSLAFYSERDFKNPQYGNIASNHFTGYFTATETGDWNIGLHWLTKNVFDWITLEQFSISEVFDNDLAISKYEAPAFATANTPGEFYVEVTNVGNNTSGAYTVQVLREEGEEAVLMGEATVTDAMNFGTTHRVYVPAVSPVTGILKTFARLVYDADQNLRNNESAVVAVTFDKEGTVPFNSIFNSGVDLCIDTRVPISSFGQYSTCQSIYYPSDLTKKLEGGKMTISRVGLSYDSNDGGTFSDYNVKVYLNTTDKTQYQCTEWNTKTEVSEWVDFGECCFDGVVSTVEGTGNVLAFNLDKEFEYDLSKNLVVTFVKEAPLPDNQFPVIFNHYANEDGGYGTTVRSLFKDGKAPFNFDTTSVFGKLFLPVLHIAANELSVGINEVSFGSAMNYDAQAGMLRGLGKGRVSVYSVSGQLIKQAEVTDGQTSLNLQGGLYILKFAGNDGQAQTMKIQVK